MNEKQYKDLSIKEFTEAAASYESNKAGLYEMCKKDYPDILAELEKEEWETLLDAGCGPGPMVTLLADKYPDRHYVGIDLTPKMIEMAQKKKLKNAEFLVGDCENLPFEKKRFDAVICSNSFHHYPNPQNFFYSVFKVLKPGGRLILRDFTAGSAVLLWLCNHVEMPLAHLCGHGDVRIYSREEIMTMCKKAGLKVERFEQRKGMRMHCVIRKPVNLSQK